MDIFASKLFKSSSRQDQIRSAVTNPINAELVKQITSYVDPQDKKYTEQGQDIEEDKLKEAQEEFSEETQDTEETDDKDSNTSSSVKHVSHTNSGEGANGHFDAPENPAEMEFDSTPDSTSDSESSKDEVSESTDIMEDSDDAESVDVDNIKSILEDDPKTSEIVRIQIKNDNSELWIYYNDRINLNSIMEDVIAKLSSYPSFEFNRLARTDNAIVFEIN